MTRKIRTRDIYDNLSSLDYRYWDPEVAKYLSENGFTRYKLRVEVALVRALHRKGLCSEEVVAEVEAACLKVTTAEVYDEEDRIHHDIRALVNCICRKLRKSSRRFVHLTATSYDIIDTANAARYRDVTKAVVLPILTKLEQTLIGMVLKELETKQIGRTHGQHAVPITFGFALDEYVSRLGGCIVKLGQASRELRGKFSGAVGAYNASSLFFDDPEVFESDILAEMGLKPAEYSTQIVPREAMTRLLCEFSMTAGVLANLADDMRHLQRTEIGEVGEAFEVNQVGSSAMPQKRNPINLENAKGCWKIVSPRIQTAFMDQISEHQRDLTNSVSERTYGEIVAYVVVTANRLNRTMSKLSVDRANMERNLAMQKDLVVAEPLYIILAALGHPDAHEKVRQLTLQAQREKRLLEEVALEDASLRRYFKSMTARQREVLRNPSLYTGFAAQKAWDVVVRWKQELGLE